MTGFSEGGYTPTVEEMKTPELKEKEMMETFRNQVRERLVEWKLLGWVPLITEGFAPEKADEVFVEVCAKGMFEIWKKLQETAKESPPMRLGFSWTGKELRLGSEWLDDKKKGLDIGSRPSVRVE